MRKIYPKLNTPERARSTQLPNEENETEILCHIRDEIKPWDNEKKIRQNLCRYAELTEHTDGNYYCLFHLPIEDKNKIEFERIFRERLKAVESAFAEAEKLPEDVRQTAKSEIHYDFRYVWFPDFVDLSNYNFITTADFSSATFTSVAYFNSTTFTSVAYFNSTTFTSDAYFKSATFTFDADFNSTTFTSDAEFRLATFTSDADFRSATFTSDADFRSATFTSVADFSSTTFTSDADFNSTTFTSVAEFKSTTFTSDAEFRSATFTSVADFNSATFTSDADFNSTTFTSDAEFSSTIFTSDADFNSATFRSVAYFNFAIFEEKSQIYFLRTKFCSFVYFYKTEIEGYVEFEGNIFLDANAVKEVRQELEKQFANLRKELAERGNKIELPHVEIADNREAVPEFQSVRLRNPERVSFNSTRLRPNWFVDVDEARRIAFNDVEWLNTEIDIDRDGLEKELESLENRGVRRRERSLIKAYNQLADNAEVNRRFEEARTFRKNALALDGKIKCHVHFAVDAHKKGDIRANVCRDYPVVNEDGGNYYCLWHNPDKNKAEIFLREFEKHQAQGFSDFRAVVFPITVEYSPEREDDDGNKFIIPAPEHLNFNGATFQRNLIFNNEFEIKNLNLSQAVFEEDADLDFKDAICKGKINLDKSVFDGKLFVRENAKTFFQNPVAALAMKDVRFDKPQNANFHSVRLRPHYFIDADAGKFNFHDCYWKDENGKELNIEDEIRYCGKHKTLAQVCNQLAVNYEENRDYEQSSYFRYTAMEARRLGYGNSFWRNFNLYRIYKFSSGYGESWKWALGLLIGLLIAFGFLYATHFSTFDSVDNSQSEIICGDKRMIGNAYGISVCHGIVHSLAVASFQRPEPKPANSLTKFFVTLETILAPLQAALLALAIRRKFMR